MVIFFLGCLSHSAWWNFWHICWKQIALQHSTCGKKSTNIPKGSSHCLMDWQHCFNFVFLGDVRCHSMLSCFVSGSKWQNQLSPHVIMPWRKLLPSIAKCSNTCEKNFLAEVCALLSASKESRRHEQPGIPNFPPQPGSHGALSETLLSFLWLACINSLW